VSIRWLIAVVCVALSACASIPRGPSLTYEGLLPNTHENPAWARYHWPQPPQQQPPQQQPPQQQRPQQ
jgi:hypothetical protein